MSAITNNTTVQKENKSFFQKNLDVIEKVGNKLPHPITLFGMFCVAIMIISAICSMMGVSATGELIDRANNNQIALQTVNVINLLSREYLSVCKETSSTILLIIPDSINSFNGLRSIES